MMRRPIPFVFVAGAAWAACAALAALGVPEGLTLCPVRLLTGHRCPGCGMGHAVVYAMRGDFAASWHAHPLGLPVLIAWTGWLFWKAGRRIIRYNDPSLAGW
ncbi:MAG: DUF2752 domain-containing protein [Elusimicrobiota bacterium]